MDFFQTFWEQLEKTLNVYIYNNFKHVAEALMPPIIAFGTIYVMLWGYLQLTGKIDEPFTAGLKRIVMLAVIFVLSAQFELYNNLIVDTFYEAPVQLASRIVAAEDPTVDPKTLGPITVVDQIWNGGSDLIVKLLKKSITWRYVVFGGTLLAIIAVIIWIVVAILCLYTMFLLALSKVALAVLLALGPLFLVMLLFESTSRLFHAWISQLTNYALVTVLTTMVSLVFLQMVRTGIQETLGRTWGISVTDMLDMALMCGLAILFMMQVPGLAASLSSGGAPLSTHGVGARAAGAVGRFSRGVASARKEVSAQARTHWSVAQKIGYAAGRRIAGLMSRQNTIERNH